MSSAENRRLREKPLAAKENRAKKPTVVRTTKLLEAKLGCPYFTSSLRMAEFIEDCSE
jgi:hypothetical protein